MGISNVPRLAACMALVMGFAHAASPADILIADVKSQPESSTVAPGGVLIVGSASTPFVYKVRSGSSTADKFIDAGAEGPGTFFFGMLVLLCYKRSEQQKGQQGSCWRSTLAMRRRMVAMEPGLCRSARTRGAAGLEAGRNCRGA